MATTLFPGNPHAATELCLEPLFRTRFHPAQCLVLAAWNGRILADGSSWTRSSSGAV